MVAGWNGWVGGWLADRRKGWKRDLIFLMLVCTYAPGKE